MSNVNLATEQLLELLLTLKKTTPAAARGILNNQPAIAYALITLMVSMNAINIEVFQRTLAEFGAANTPESSSSLATSTPTPQTATMNSTPLSAIPPHLQAQYRTTTPPSVPHTPPFGSYPPHAAANGQGSSHSYTSTPPNMDNHGYGQQGYSGQYQQQQQQQPSAYPAYPTTYGGQAVPHQPTPPMPPAPSPNLTDALASIPDEQKALIMRVLAMTPEQINMLPPTERSTYIQIRATLGIPTG
ncbi:hypothetical protein BYT27DRAFT_7180276 [Phlegmacium glaucopus]|nr:hypothetical protein BYT27DRAFT_7180276 [Phlegmacium glaucopus]